MYAMRSAGVVCSSRAPRRSRAERMKKARVVRWESLEVYCVGRWVLRQRSQYLMCLALLNVGGGSEDMVLLAF